MKRRKFVRYAALSGASFLSVNGAFVNSKSARAFGSVNLSDRSHFDWIFLYWMPYDNNLSRLGIPILNMITRGVRGDNILVLVQSDFSGAKQLSRSIITNGEINTYQLNTANSASEDGFAEYLNWARSQFQAQKWAIVFLGHGGGLDAIAPDEHPGNSSSRTQWMNIHKLSEIIIQFNQAVSDRVELFFFQNCNKGTLEAHYTLSQAANYTLSSQKLLGAPNYYYESLFQYLASHPEVDGSEVAEKISQFERSDMYSSYTVTNNRSFSNLTAKIIPLIDSILVSDLKNIELKNLNTYRYASDRFVDVVEFFEYLVNQSGGDRENYQTFINAFQESTVYFLNPNSMDKNLSGLGVLLPRDRQHLNLYRYLPVFSDLKLAELWENLKFDS